MHSCFKILNLSCINVKEKKMDLKTPLNKQYMSHIDDYIANHVDDAIDIVLFLDLRQASAKERETIYF